MLKIIIVMFVVSIFLQLVGINYANALANRCRKSSYYKMNLMQVEVGTLSLGRVILCLIPVVNIIIVTITLVYLFLIDIKLRDRGI